MFSWDRLCCTISLSSIPILRVRYSFFPLERGVLLFRDVAFDGTMSIGNVKSREPGVARVELMMFICRTNLALNLRLRITQMTFFLKGGS